jgi:hypothetical protein
VGGGGAVVGWCVLSYSSRLPAGSTARAVFRCLSAGSRTDIASKWAAPPFLEKKRRGTPFSADPAVSAFNFWMSFFIFIF